MSSPTIIPGTESHIVEINMSEVSQVLQDIDKVIADRDPDVIFAASIILAFLTQELAIEPEVLKEGVRGCSSFIRKFLETHTLTIDTNPTPKHLIN